MNVHINIDIKGLLQASDSGLEWVSLYCGSFESQVEGRIHLDPNGTGEGPLILNIAPFMSFHVNLGEGM